VWLQELLTTAKIVKEWVAAQVGLEVAPAVIVEEFTRRMECAFSFNVNIERDFRAAVTYPCPRQVYLLSYCKGLSPSPPFLPSSWMFFRRHWSRYDEFFGFAQPNHS
jgi:hypothetical protein